ncbi:tRNA (guanine-N(7)-)-methyltransferase non-catalytic subunit trm82 [Coemansia brasiliensis]|uniref:tRNA (Guanine-N(7)-)-methyltransferase non-catalytic subunit trm82 n=1 Tax=Coemansia brasiliensis TaxID=2650707 RepID=A0A9W8I7Z9_9FUNG|nr:tRNA (guanine-N(7)-)-methyltransferase non-catalytic subunit trm82 [Coemansia brasiliensis]
MVRSPITHVETSSQGLIALVCDSNFHVTNSSGTLVASTSSDQNGVKRIEEPGRGPIVAVAFSQDGSMFAACTNEKNVAIYSVDTWSARRTLCIAKRATALAFDLDGSYLLIADKFGEVYRASTSASDADCKPDLLLGHVSIVCDVKVTFTQPSRVLTCDRDEKLRVSKYPNSYNIQSFGLGHKEFVTSIATAQFAPACAVTGSGDGTIRLWEIESGQLLQTIQLDQILHKYYQDGRAQCGVDSFEDRNASMERYGVLRVRAVESMRAFVAAVERIPAVVVLPFNNLLENIHTIDIDRAPTDIAVAGSQAVVSFVPSVANGGSASDDLVVVLELADNGTKAKDLTSSLNAIPTQQVEQVSPIPSIYVWGNKMYMEHPKE